MNKQEKLEQQKRRRAIYERSLVWKDKNPLSWAIVQVVTIMAVAIGITAFIIIVFTPHPQHVEALIHCDNVTFAPNYYTPTSQYLMVKNCTIKANATIWISEEQLVANKTA
jgi:hypothetical protein